MRHTATFSCRADRAEEIYRALLPEAEEINARSDARIALSGGNVLIISVSAVDIPALRAALNMWLRLVSVASEMLDIPATGATAPG